MKLQVDAAWTPRHAGAAGLAVLALLLSGLAGPAWSQAPESDVARAGTESPEPAQVQVELHGDEPLAQHLMLRFMQGHPDLMWRMRGRAAYAKGEYAYARDCFERAARFADKPSQAMLGEMHWNGVGGPRDRELGYAWMDLAAERLYEDFYRLRERYWSRLGPAERERAVRRGQELLRRYGDDRTKPRLAEILVRERPNRIAVGGFFGNLPIIPPSGAGRDSVTLRYSEYFDDTFWDPEAYFAWQDTIWKTLLTTGRVDVGDPRAVPPAPID